MWDTGVGLHIPAAPKFCRTLLPPVSTSLLLCQRGQGPDFATELQVVPDIAVCSVMPVCAGAFDSALGDRTTPQAYVTTLLLIIHLNHIYIKIPIPPHGKHSSCPLQRPIS
jgi:hypothetical protein